MLFEHVKIGASGFKVKKVFDESQFLMFVMI